MLFDFLGVVYLSMFKFIISKTIQLFLLFFITIELGADNQEIDRVKLQLQWKHQFEFAGFYVAQEKGFYRDVGLSVEFIEYNKHKNISDEVLSGNAHYGLSYSSIIAEYMDGKPISLIANFFKQSPLVLITQENIPTPKYLKGKRVMGVSNSIDNITLLLMLNKFGVKSEDIINIPTTFNIEDFIQKRVDAMSVFTTNELYYLNQRGIKYNIFDPVVYGAKYYDVNLFTSKEEVLKHPSRVQRFKEASIKGWEYALKHRDEIVNIILDKYNTQHKSREALLFEAIQIEQIMLPNIYEIGSIDIDRLQIIADSFVQSGFVKKKRSLESFIYKDKTNLLNLTKKEKEFIKRHPEIVLGTEKKWAPYIIVSKSGKISGYDADVLNLINNISGANFKLKAGDWSDMQIKARNKEIDGLSTGGIHKERKEYLNFSNIYIEMQKMLIVSKSNPKNIHTVKDLIGKTIAIHRSNLVDEKIAQKYTKSKILRLDSLIDVMSSVVSGEADVTFGNDSLMYMANMKGVSYLKYAGSLDEKLSLAFGVRKDYPEAISILNKSLAYIGKHKLLELKNRWFFAQNKINKELFEDIELKYLENKKEITMCVDPSWMPLEAIINSKYVGMGADFKKLFEDRLKIPIRVIQSDKWSQSLEYAKSRRCDILSLSMPTQERQKYLSFTSSFLQLPLAIATLSQKPNIIDISFIEHERVAIIKNYAAADMIREKYPNLEVVEVQSIEEGFSKVEQGELFGFVDNSATLEYYFANTSYNKFKIGAYFDEKLSLGLGVRNDDEMLYSILQKAIEDISIESRKSVIKKWLFREYDRQFDYDLFWKFLLLISIIAIFGLYRHFNIKRLNRELKMRVQEELKKSRDKDKMLYHQNKLAAMGEMLENIAHQWRQPLAQINSSVLLIDDILYEHEFKNEDIEEKLLEIESLTNYMSRTIDDFKNFLKKNRNKERVILKDNIEKSVNIVKVVFKKHNIELYYNIYGKFEWYGYSNELQQVIVALLSNAKDALVDRDIYLAKITISVELIDEFYVIKICDNAGGISDKIKDKIFEPYFTTKHKSQGTGLGLYMSKKIIQESLGGELSFYNDEFGACFEIKLYKDNR